MGRPFSLVFILDSLEPCVAGTKRTFFLPLAPFITAWTRSPFVDASTPRPKFAVPPFHPLVQGNWAPSRMLLFFFPSSRFQSLSLISSFFLSGEAPLRKSAPPLAHRRMLFFRSSFFPRIAFLLSLQHQRISRSFLLPWTMKLALSILTTEDNSRREVFFGGMVCLPLISNVNASLLVRGACRFLVRAPRSSSPPDSPCQKVEIVFRVASRAFPL